MSIHCRQNNVGAVEGLAAVVVLDRPHLSVIGHMEIVLKSVPNDEYQGMSHPRSPLYASIFERGARETSANVVSRPVRSERSPSESIYHVQFGRRFSHAGSNIK